MSKLIEQLKRHEGLKLKPYKCTAGKLTIGYGRNLDDVGITEIEAEDLLYHDLKKIKHNLSLRGFYVALSGARADAIDNMAFNIGISGLFKFKKMIAAIESQDYELAAKEMLDSKWAKQVPNRANELAEQMRTGEYQQ